MSDITITGSQQVSVTNNHSLRPYTFFCYIDSECTQIRVIGNRS